MPEPPDPEQSHREVTEAPQADAPKYTTPSRPTTVEFLREWGGWISLGGLAFQAVLLGAGFSKRFGSLLYVSGFIILIFAIATAIVCESDPRKPERSTVQRWGAIATAFSLTLGFGASNSVVWFFSVLNDLATQVQKYPQVIIGLIILALGFSGWWFVRVFTCALPTGQATEKDLIPMVRFCYVFTLMVLAISVVGPILVFVFPNPDYDLVARGPVSLVKGCVHSDDLKWELACSEKDPFKLEWFINIGGAARPASLPSNGTTTSAYAAVDSWIEAKSYRPMIVHGGLVIPWYFIALALMGAAVSLARRIPEYQRRALEPKDEDFTAPRAREYMEFQILQLLSAPLIAVAAYNLVTPGTLQASTAIGFITGFSSETILVAIGALADRLIGKSTKAEPKKEEPKKEETEIGEPQK